MQVCRIFLSQNIRHQNVSITVVMIIRVIYKNIKKPNSLSKCITNHLSLQTMYQTLIQSLIISLYTLRIKFKFHCFTVHFNSLNLIYQLMH